MTVTQSAHLLRAATADRLARMFRLAVAHADEQGDIALAIEAMSQTEREHSGADFLRILLARLANCANATDAVALTHEERVSLYVASKLLTRNDQP